MMDSVLRHERQESSDGWPKSLEVAEMVALAVGGWISYRDELVEASNHASEALSLEDPCYRPSETAAVQAVLRRHAEESEPWLVNDMAERLALLAEQHLVAEQASSQECLSQALQTARVLRCRLVGEVQEKLFPGSHSALALGQVETLP
jgi:hypothetical protein